MNYGDNRYKKGGNSGQGSYGRLAEFKLDIINEFIKARKLTTLVDVGCGDANIGSQIKVKNYIGTDISDSIIEKNKVKYPDRKFVKYSELSGVADVVLSLDVIFHLIEDKDYEDHMRFLFEHAEKYVIIYSSCKDTPYRKDALVRHHNFVSWIKKNVSAELIDIIPNRYPITDRVNPESFADFYIFKV